MKDYYYILGVEKNATTDDIKKAYKKLALKFHPDQNGGDRFFENRFKDIQEAYDCLSNPERREQYDYQLFNQKNDKKNTSFIKEDEEVTPSGKDKVTPLIAIALITIIGFFILNAAGADFTDIKDDGLFAIGLLVAANAFLSPFLAAIYNRHPYKWAILGAVLILGWTGLGWLACLVFALLGNKADD